MTQRKPLLAGVVVALVGCLALADTPMKKLSATGFVGRTGETTVIVDTDLATQSGEEPFVPLIVWVGHRERHAIKAVRGSFSLVDPKGAKVQLPGLSEVVKGYGNARISADYSRLKMQAEHYQYGDMEYFYGRPLKRVAFFPNPSGGQVLYDEVEIPSRMWFRTLLYFPNPGGRPAEPFSLVFEDAEGKQRVEVPFVFNWSKR